MKVTMIQTVVLCQKRKIVTEMVTLLTDLCVRISTNFFLIPPTLCPQHPKLTWAGESTPSLFTW